MLAYLRLLQLEVEAEQAGAANQSMHHPAKTVQQANTRICAPAQQTRKGQFVSTVEVAHYSDLCQTSIPRCCALVLRQLACKPWFERSCRTEEQKQCEHFTPRADCVHAYLNGFHLDMAHNHDQRWTSSSSRLLDLKLDWAMSKTPDVSPAWLNDINFNFTSKPQRFIFIYDSQMSPAPYSTHS